MGRPSIQVEVVGGSQYVLPVLPLDDEGNHVLQRTVLAFPRPEPSSGQVIEENFLPYRHVSQHAPLGIGLKNQYDPRRVFDMEADARFPSGIYLPRLITTNTFPAEVAAVQYRLFAHSNGEFWMAGTGSGIDTANEPLLRFDGTNWADTTLKDDIGVGADIIRGMDSHKGELHLLVEEEGGAASPGMARRNASNTVWTGNSVNSIDMVAPVGGANNRGLVSDGTNLFSTSLLSSRLTVYRSTTDGESWAARTSFEGGDLARGLKLFGDGAASEVLDPWVTAPQGLYHHHDATNTYTKRVTFQHPESSYSGQLEVCPHGLLFSDGPNLFLGFWLQSRFAYESLGPEDLDDGVPLEQAGDITWIAYDNIRDEVVVGKSGLAASRNQVIYFYSFVTKLWSAKMGRNTTANRASFAGSFSTETDGRNRLHFTRDNGVASDSEAIYLDYISENPDVQTAATFAASGTITRSRFNGGVHLFKKAFLKGQYVANALTSTETLSVKFATDGGTLGSAQVTTSTAFVQELSTDGATNAVGTSANDIYDEITMARDTTTTLTPKIRALCWAYEVMGLKSNGTPIRTFTFRISLARGDYGEGMDVESAKNARDILETILGTVPLVKLAFGQDFPIGSEIKVRMQPYEGRRIVGDVRDQVDVPIDGPGYQDVTFSEVI